MSIINRLLKELFPEKPESTKGLKEVLVREMIQRNQRFLDGYKQWIKEEMHLGLLNHLQESRLLSDNLMDSQVNFFTHSEAASSGVYFHGERPWNSSDYAFLIHYFIEQLASLDYYSNNTKREVVEEEGHLKTVERFYLKPGLKYRREVPYNQLFGNVLIEHRQLEDETVLVKLMANTYNDRNFKKPYDFEDLLDKLLVV